MAMKDMLAAAIFIAACSQAQADDQISIKTLHLGLRTSVVMHGQYKLCDAAAARNPTNACFTIGGAPISNLISETDEDGRIDILAIEFATENYEAVKAAVVGKYPGAKCSTQTVQNKMGAKFVDEQCTYVTLTETLTVSRFTSKLTTGRIGLVSNARLERQKAAESKKKGDI